MSPIRPGISKQTCRRLTSQFPILGRDGDVVELVAGVVTDNPEGTISDSEVVVWGVSNAVSEAIAVTGPVDGGWLARDPTAGPV